MGSHISFCAILRTSVSSPDIAAIIWLYSGLPLLPMSNAVIILDDVNEFPFVEMK